MNLFYEEQLQKIFANINEWLKFAEAKNFGLITLNAGIIFGLGQINFDGESVINFVYEYVLVVFLSISFLICLISFFPFLSKISKKENLKGIISKFSRLIDKEKKFENIFFYGHLRKLNQEKFITEFKTKTNSTEEFSPYEVDLVMQILYNSRIAWLKYQLFKIAGFATLFGIIVFLFALILKSLIK